MDEQRNDPKAVSELRYEAYRIALVSLCNSLARAHREAAGSEPTAEENGSDGSAQ